MRWSRMTDGRRRWGRRRGALCRRRRRRRTLRGRARNGRRAGARAIASCVDGRVMDLLLDDDRRRRRLLHWSSFDWHQWGDIMTSRHLVPRERECRSGREKPRESYGAANSAQRHQANDSEATVTGRRVGPLLHQSSPPGDGDGDGDECAGGEGLTGGDGCVPGCVSFECPSSERPLLDCATSGAVIGALGATGRSYMSTTLWMTAGVGAGYSARASMGVAGTWLRTRWIVAGCKPANGPLACAAATVESAPAPVVSAATSTIDPLRACFGFGEMT
jgi:hypothetical protein